MNVIFKIILLQSIICSLNANIQDKYSKTGEKEFIAPVVDNSKHNGGILDASLYGNNMLYTQYVNRTDSKLIIQEGNTPLDWMTPETDELLKGLSRQQREELSGSIQTVEGLKAAIVRQSRERDNDKYLNEELGETGAMVVQMSIRFIDILIILLLIYSLINLKIKKDRNKNA